MGLKRETGSLERSTRIKKLTLNIRRTKITSTEKALGIVSKFLF